MATDTRIQVTVVYSPGARDVQEMTLSLAHASTVLQAIQASGFLKRFPALAPHSLIAGIWGRKASLNHGLRDKDRVEIYRPLTVDPKVARRERFAKQGARTAGLFSTKRPGAKAGY